jgi:hypothetical protein
MTKQNHASNICQKIIINKLILIPTLHPLHKFSMMMIIMSLEVVAVMTEISRIACSKLSLKGYHLEIIWKVPCIFFERQNHMKLYLLLPALNIFSHFLGMKEAGKGGNCFLIM